jgi:tetratricopeptide (TPR) repeat protein
MKTFKTIQIACYLFVTSIAFAQNETAIKYEIENDRLKSASAMANSALASDPGNGRLYYLLGQVHMLSGNTALANEAFTKGKDAKTNTWLNHIGLGWIALNNGDAAGAQKLFDVAAVPAGPKNAEYHYLVAYAYFMSKKQDVDKTLAALDKCLALQPAFQDALLLKGDALLMKPDGGGKALTAYEDAEARFKDSPAPQVRIARLYMNARNYPLALEYINKSLEKDANYSPGHKIKGDYTFNLKKYQEARANYEKALSLSDSTDQLLTQYLYACFLSKDYAITYELSSKLKGSAVNPFVLNRAEAYSLFETGKYPESLESIQRLFNSGTPERLIRQDYMYYGKILSKNKQDSLAIGYFEKAWEADSTDTEALVEMAKSYSNLGYYDRSAEMYKKKIGAGAPAALDYFFLGRSLYYHKNYPAADSAFAMVAELQPNAYHGFFWRGRCNSVMDPDIKSDSTKVFYEKAAELAAVDPVKNKKDLVECYQYMAFYYVKKDNISRASEYFRKVLEIDPENKEAKANLNQLNQKK